MTEYTKNTAPEKGTSNLIIGSGVGAYGALSLVLTGAVCPACIVITPTLLGYGAYQRYKFNQTQTESLKEDTVSVE